MFIVEDNKLYLLRKKMYFLSEQLTEKERSYHKSLFINI